MDIEEFHRGYVMGVVILNMSESTRADRYSSVENSV